MWEKMMSIDRRIFYAIIFIFVSIGLINPLGLPIPIGPQAQRHYDFIESLPSGGVLVMDAAHGPGAMAELGPMMRATAIHAFRKDMRIIIFNMSWELGPAMAHEFVEEAGAMFGKSYGTDWVNLGFQPGGAPVNLQAAVASFAEARPTDWVGTPLAQLPLMNEVKALTPEYVDHAIVYAGGTPGTEDWLAYVGEPTGLTLSEGSIQMSIGNALPFLDAGQYKSIIPGGRGGAEYELLLGEPGAAIAGQDVLSMAALFMVAILILGNVGYFLSRSKD